MDPDYLDRLRRIGGYLARHDAYPPRFGVPRWFSLAHWIYAPDGETPRPDAAAEIWLDFLLHHEGVRWEDASDEDRAIYRAYCREVVRDRAERHAKMEQQARSESIADVAVGVASFAVLVLIVLSGPGAGAGILLLVMVWWIRMMIALAQETEDDPYR